MTSLPRIKNDFYPTPEPITQALLDVVDIGGLVFEPCAGESAISRVLRKDSRVTQVIESDLTWGEDVPRDATTDEFWQHWTERSKVDWVVTNPPFSLAPKILPKAWANATLGCSILLRISYIEPTDNRAKFHKNLSDHLRYITPVNPRVKFRKDVTGTDNATCAWFVWDKRWSWSERGIQSPFQFIKGWR